MSQLSSQRTLAVAFAVVFHVAALGLLACSSTYRRARSIADVATSRIGSAARSAHPCTTHAHGHASQP